MIDQSETAGQRCPLPPLAELRSNSGEHYSPKRTSVATADAGEGLSEWAVRRIEDKGRKRIEVAGSIWDFAEQLSVEWGFGPDDPRYKDADAGGPINPKHIHASFRIGGHDVHADYVMFMSWGPLSGTEEFLVFIDGVLRGRGGNFTCTPGQIHRNWPLAIPLQEQLLLFDKKFAGESDLSMFAGLSLWKRQST